MRNENDVLFLFPPFVESCIAGPHLAVPLLKTIANEAGIAARSIDLNIRLIRFILEDPEFVHWLGNGPDDERCKTVLQKMDKVNFVGQSKTIRWLLSIVRENLFGFPGNLTEALDYDSKAERHQFPASIYERLLFGEMETPPKVVAISVAFAEQMPESIRIAHLIREKYAGDVKILLGGSQINLLQKEQLAELDNSEIFDVVFVGNGENRIGDLVKSCLTDDLPKSRLLFSGSITKQEINSIPQTEFEDLQLYLGEIRLPVLVTKGCFWGQCSFCDYVKLADIGSKRFVARDVHVVFDEIKSLQSRYGVESFNLISDAVPPSWYRRLARLAVDEGIVLGSWSYLMHHSSLDRNFFQLLADAGVSAVTFGTESFSDKLLKKMKKQANADTNIRNIVDAADSGLQTTVNLIPDYPSSDMNDVLKTSNAVDSICDSISVLNPQSFDLTSETEVAKDYKSFGINASPTGYYRSNHGLHSLEFERVEGLSKFEAEMACNALGQASARIALRKRVRLAQSFIEAGEGSFFVDPSLLLFENRYEVVSIAVGGSIPIQDIELLIRYSQLEGLIKLPIHSLPTEESSISSVEELFYVARYGIIVPLRPNLPISLSSTNRQLESHYAQPT